MKKILMFILLFVSLFSVVNADLTTNNQAYWKFDTSTTTQPDSTGNSNTISVTNAVYTGSGKINGSYDFDGTGDYMTRAQFPFISVDDSFSVSLWFKADTTAGVLQIFNNNPSSTDRIILNIKDGGLYYSTYDGTTAFGLGDSSFTDTTNWHHVVITNDDSKNFKMYIDGVEETTSQSYSGSGVSAVLNLGVDGGGTQEFNGKIDEVSIWDRTLTAGEVTTLFNSDTGLQYPYTVAGEPVLTFNYTKANNETFIDNSYFNDTINFETLITNTSTNGNVNQSYSINGNTSIQYVTNEVLGSFNLTQSDGNYNISFYAYNNETNVTSSTYSFTIDTTNPTITDPLNATELDSYVFNVSTITCTDTNLDYCNITIEGTEYDLLTTDIITLTINGNSSYNLSSGDLAGNTNTLTGYVFVNPYQYFYFQKEGSPVTNFTFGGVEFTDYAKFKVYNENISLGSNSLTWGKNGYATQTINFTVTNTSNINSTYNVSLATIYVNIRDKDTGNFVTGTTTVEFISVIGLIETTTNGTLAITNTLFTDDTYTLVVTNPAYIAENVYFTFTNIEIVTIDVYMTLNTTANAGILPVKVLDSNGNPVNNALVKAKQWFSSSSSFVTTSQALTDQIGTTELNVLLDDKVYIITATYENDYVETNQQTFYLVDTTRDLVLTLEHNATDEELYFLYNVIASATEDWNENTNTSTITFTWEDTLNQGLTGCINTYRSINGQVTRINTDCTTSPATTYIQAYTLNTSQDIVLRAEMLIDGEYYPIKSFVHNSKQNPATILANIGFNIMIIPILFILCVVIGIAAKNVYIGTFLMMVSSGMSLTLAPGIFTGGVVAFCFAIGGIILYGGTR